MATTPKFNPKQIVQVHTSDSGSVNSNVIASGSSGAGLAVNVYLVHDGTAQHLVTEQGIDSAI